MSPDNNMCNYNTEFIKKHINDKNFVFNNFLHFPPIVLINCYVNDELFTEKFILDNIKYFNEVIELIVRRKKNISNDFLIAICNKSNYSKIKTTRQLFEIDRNFSTLDNLFY